jgi:murein L,D-transpeptidase YafK
VDKAKQKVMLYESDDLTAPIKVYPCSTGEHDGPKSVINDKKTPEGIYFFVNSYKKDQLAPIYGSMAFPLNYPNFFDQKEGKTGHGIWFHGTNKPLRPNDTSGCVALANKDIEDLSSFIKLFSTPVIITSNVEMATQEELEEKAKTLSDIIDGWRDAWQNKDLERYISFYHKSFESGGKNRAQWKNYKARLMNKYKEIGVEVENLGILISNNVVIASFTQRYSTAAFKSQGLKRLYLAKNSEEWKIIGETFAASDFVASIVSVPEAATAAEMAPVTETASAPESTVVAAATAPEPAPVVETARVAGTVVEPEPATAVAAGPSPETTALPPPVNEMAAATGVITGAQAATAEGPEALTNQPAHGQKEGIDHPAGEAMASTGVRKEIESFISSWIDAWEKEDLDSYMGCYDPQFESRGMDLAAWKKHRIKLNKKYRTVTVEISDLKITEVSDREAEIAFIQDYRAGGYADRGAKNMLIVKKDKEWKIKKEDWTALSE